MPVQGISPSPEKRRKIGEEREDVDETGDIKQKGANRASSPAGEKTFLTTAPVKEEGKAKKRP